MNKAEIYVGYGGGKERFILGWITEFLLVWVLRKIKPIGQIGS